MLDDTPGCRESVRCARWPVDTVVRRELLLRLLKYRNGILKYLGRRCQRTILLIVEASSLYFDIYSDSKNISHSYSVEGIDILNI